MVTIPLTSVLTVLGVLSLWIMPPPVDRFETVLWEIIIGGGFAVVGCAVTIISRDSLPGRLFVLAAVLLTVAPLVGIGYKTAADALAVTAAALVIPVALLRIVPRGRKAPILGALEMLAVLAGGACVAASTLHETKGVALLE
jgi:hypothetical protein